MKPTYEELERELSRYKRAVSMYLEIIQKLLGSAKILVQHSSLPPDKKGQVAEDLVFVELRVTRLMKEQEDG